ncbi:anti-sigma factor domain-containing protein [Streptomyces sp. NPDC048441]|uniref:anti-sigma factor domain-containing protein n=1 Tax=Streptomyces sp. NPDC048441 TaxID=3365552 RepID=UPI00372136EE
MVPKAGTFAWLTAAGGLVVSDSRNQAAILATNLPAPPRGKIYQLWFDDHRPMRPARRLAWASRSNPPKVPAGPPRRRWPC